MPTVKEVFEIMEKDRQQEVSAMDEFGYSERFKLATEKFIQLLKEDELYAGYFKDNPRPHVKDVEYLDGYFIFGHGTNSVIEFRIEECPGWLFGIWWYVPRTKKERQKDKYTVRGEFFGQYEETIDKFKPSRSNIASEIIISLNEDEMCNSIYECRKQINFIITQPHLAFCRDYLGWNYNEEYHSKEEAEREFKKYLKKEEKETRIKKENDAIVMEWVTKNIVPLYKNARIIDSGESWSPRYDVIVPFEENKEALGITEMGCYSWFESKEEPLAKKWLKLKDRLYKGALNKDVYWSCQFHESVEVFDIKEEDKDE